MVIVEAAHVVIVHVGVLLLQVLEHLAEVYHFIHVVEASIVEVVALQVVVLVVVLIVVLVREDLEVVVLFDDLRILGVLRLLDLLFLERLELEEDALVAELDNPLDKLRHEVVDAWRQLADVLLYEACEAECEALDLEVLLEVGTLVEDLGEDVEGVACVLEGDEGGGSVSEQSHA